MKNCEETSIMTAESVLKVFSGGKHRIIEYMRLRSLGYRIMPVDNYIVLYLVDKDKTEIQIDGIFYSKYNDRNDR